MSPDCFRSGKKVSPASLPVPFRRRIPARKFILKNKKQQKHADRCKPDSVLRLKRMGNHLSMRPEPGVHDAASNGSPSIWSCCGRGLPCGAAFADTPGGLLPHLFTLTRTNPGGMLSVALAFLRRIVRSILLFKRTPCSMQSGLSSTARRRTPPAAIARNRRTIR